MRFILVILLLVFVEDVAMEDLEVGTFHFLARDAQSRFWERC